MKTPLLFARFAIIGMMLSFVACDLLDKADDVTFDQELEIIWNADENAEGSNVPYASLDELDLADYPEIAKYANKIKEIKVNRITYRITNYDASPHHSQVIFNNGSASFMATGSSTPAVTVPYAASASGVNLQTTTAETDLSINQDGLNKIASLLKDNNKVSVSTSGVLSVTPVQFSVINKYYVTITANALD